MTSPIKVLIVSHSPLTTQILNEIIQSDQELTVISSVKNGQEALFFLQKHKPQVVMIDDHLPEMDGIETTHQIMQKTPVPIILVSQTFEQNDMEKSFKAFQAGALEIIAIPKKHDDPAYQTLAEQLLTSIHHAAILKLSTRRYFHKHPTKTKASPDIRTILKANPIFAVAIGSSQGGPKALNAIFSNLPPQFPVPIFVVQHIAPGFTKGLVDWLQQSSSIKIALAQDGEIAQPGTIYIAPANVHLEVQPQSKIHLSQDPPEEGLRPAVSRLFRSMAEVYGSHGMGIILSGMGRDGAAELLEMKNKGAVTIAQDRASSFIFGMPKEAINLDAAKFVLSLDQITTMLKLLAD